MLNLDQSHLACRQLRFAAKPESIIGQSDTLEAHGTWKAPRCLRRRAPYDDGLDPTLDLGWCSAMFKSALADRIAVVGVRRLMADIGLRVLSVADVSSRSDLLRMSALENNAADASRPLDRTVTHVRATACNATRQPARVSSPAPRRLAEVR